MTFGFQFPDREQIADLRSKGEVAFSAFSIRAATTAVAFFWISTVASKVIQLSPLIITASSLSEAAHVLKDAGSFALTWVLSLIGTGFLIAVLQTKFLLHFGLMSFASRRRKTSIWGGFARIIWQISSILLGIGLGVALAYLVIPGWLALLREPLEGFKHVGELAGLTIFYILGLVLIFGMVSIATAKLMFLFSHRVKSTTE